MPKMLTMCLLLCLLSLTTAIDESSNPCDRKTNMDDDIKLIEPTNCKYGSVLHESIPETTVRLELIDNPDLPYDKDFVRVLKNLPHLKEIILNGPKSLDSLPNGTFFLPNLQRVTIEGTSIKSVPYHMLQNTTISKLTLASNPNFSVPKNAPMLASNTLEVLHLTSSNLDRVYRETFSELPNLVILDLIDNQLEILPAGFLAKNSRLNSLLISSNRLRHADSSTVLTPSIKHISLHENPCVMAQSRQLVSLSIYSYFILKPILIFLPILG